MTHSEALEGLLLVLEDAGVAHLLVGSWASGFWGEARMTVDADIVLLASPGEVLSLAERLEDEWLMDLAAVQEAAGESTSYNIFHSETMLKADLFFGPRDAFMSSCMRRAQSEPVFGPDRALVRVESAEDVILSKLVWYLKGGRVSERQWRDVIGVIQVQDRRLDRDYLSEWSPQLGVADLLDEAFAEAAAELGE